MLCLWGEKSKQYQLFWMLNCDSIPLYQNITWSKCRPVSFTAESPFTWAKLLRFLPVLQPKQRATLVERLPSVLSESSSHLIFHIDAIVPRSQQIKGWEWLLSVCACAHLSHQMSTNHLYTKTYLPRMPVLTLNLLWTQQFERIH